VRPPISFVYGNCLFGAGLDDGWAAFAVSAASYAWLSQEGKRARFMSLLGALEATEADLQIVRVTRRWDPTAYAREMAGEPGAVHVRARRRYVEEHARRLADIGVAQPSVFFLVSLRDPERDVASYVSKAAEQHPREWLQTLRRTISMRDGRLLGVSELERARVRADQAHARLADFLPVRPVRGVELQWLIRRAFCRGLGEPLLDGLHEPRALVCERNGEAVLAPLEGDVMRWMDGYVEHRGRVLRIESELGTSWQAQLVVGALPERATFPSPRVELMFAPVESLPFGIDLSLNARFLPNELALRIARRRVQDADQIVRAESDGEQGVTDQGYQRTQEARDLLAYLQSSSRPPLLRATIAIAIGARDEEELEERVEMCRRAYGEIRLHRPLGDQLELFCQHLPGQRTRVAGYDDTLTPEQVAAMMPTATHEAGSRKGLLPRAHPVGVEPAGQVQPQGGVRERSQHDDPQRGGARLGQDDARSEAQVRGVPAGRARDRLRPEGGPSLSPAGGGGAARRVHRAAPRSRAARDARPAARGARAPAPGRCRLVPARPLAGARRAGLGDGGGEGGRPRAAPLRRADLPGGGASARRGR
jgi:hypothetical protein